MKRSRKTERPRGSTALPSRSNAMMSSAVTSAGASERDIKKWLGLLGSRALTWPKPSSTPNSARTRLPITISSVTAASLAEGGAAGVWACDCGKTNRAAKIANNTRQLAVMVASPRAMNSLSIYFLEHDLSENRYPLFRIMLSSRRQHRKGLARMTQIELGLTGGFIGERGDPRRRRTPRT